MALFLFQFSNPAHAASIKELYEQALMAYGKGQYDQAKDRFEQINLLTKSFAPSYNGLGMVAEAQNADQEEIVRCFKTAVNIDPNYAQAYENLGRAYYAYSDIDKAHKYFRKAIGIDPSLAGSQLSLGWIYLLGKSEPYRAIGYFKKAIKIRPIPNAYYGLGMAYFANDKRVEALDMITQLRGMGQEELASQLEKTVRENRKVVPDPGSQGNSSGKPPSPNFEPDHAVAYKKPVQVRLKGKLPGS